MNNTSKKKLPNLIGDLEILFSYHNMLLGSETPKKCL